MVNGVYSPQEQFGVEYLAQGRLDMQTAGVFLPALPPEPQSSQMNLFYTFLVAKPRVTLIITMT